MINVSTGLSAEQETKLAVGQLLRKQPFFGSLILRKKIVITEDVPTAATDGTTYYVNPHWFVAVSREGRVFILCHEGCHDMLRHLPRMASHADRGFVRAEPCINGGGVKQYPYDHDTMNRAQDFYINAMLRRVLNMEVPAKGLYRGDLDDQSLTAESIYAQLCEESPPPPRQPQGGQGTPSDADGQPSSSSGQGDPQNYAGKQPMNWDEHRITDGTPKDNADLEEKVKGDVEAARQAAKSQGEMPSELEEFINELLKPKIDWRTILQKCFRTVYGRDRRSYKKPHKRRAATGHTGHTPNIINPRMVSNAHGEVGVVVDTSGSISHEERVRYLTEIYNLAAKFKVQRLVIYMTHSEVYNITTVKSPEDIKNLPFSSGGTHMEGAFPIVGNVQPKCDLVVVLTDGWTSFNTPESGDVPCGKNNVVWLMTTDKVAPYGRNIKLEVEE